MVLERIGEKLSIISDSFVDIMSIVERRSGNLSMTDNEALGNELETAKRLISASTFYQSFTGNDIEVIRHINPENCDIERWDTLDWSNAVPWIGTATHGRGGHWRMQSFSPH